MIVSGSSTFCFFFFFLFFLVFSHSLLPLVLIMRVLCINVIAIRAIPGSDVFSTKRVFTSSSNPALTIVCDAASHFVL